MSIIEVLITCAVVGLLLTMVAGFLVPAMKMQGQGAARAEMQQQTSIAMNRLVADLQSSSSGGIGVLPPSGTDPVGLGIVPILQVDALGTSSSQVWATEAICYFWYPGNEKLIRKRYPPDPPAVSVPFAPSRPVRLTPGDLLQIANSDNDTEVLLASHVNSFTIQHAGIGTSVTPPMTVTMRVVQTIPHSNKPEQFLLQRSITFRNDS
ncbi:MAG: hypothetical protein AB1758_17670 [Candidatus Eremiobacterota bacterium]